MEASEQSIAEWTVLIASGAQHSSFDNLHHLGQVTSKQSDSMLGKQVLAFHLQ